MSLFLRRYDTIVVFAFFKENTILYALSCARWFNDGDVCNLIAEVCTTSMQIVTFTLS